MSAGVLTAQQLRSIAEEKWERDGEAVAVGLHVASAWTGPDELDLRDGPARVVRADTVFCVRQALRDAEQSRARIILLTRLQQGDLGLDVVGRLARSRLFAVDQWATLCALFRARELDRSISDPAIARALIEHAPPDGYPPVSAGVLDGGTVWRALGRHVFDMDESEPDLVSLILWATGGSGPARYQAAPADLRTSLRNRLVANLGDAADSILRFVESGAGADALALAAACRVVFGDGEGDVLEAAAARMEPFHGHRPIPPSIGRRLARVAADAAADLDRREDAGAAHRHLARADELLRQLRGEAHAHRSPLTPLGFEQRLTRLAGRLEAVVADLGGETIADCERLLAAVLEHRIARLGRRRDQVVRAEMALRLVRWLARPSTAPASFPELADFYRRELAFVDRARESITRGDDQGDLTRAYQAIDRAVLDRREAFNRPFALALADWNAAGSASGAVLGVEEVLLEVLARIVKAGNRALLVVLDGMSWAVCHELLEDLRQEHWGLATLDKSSAPPPSVVAAIPSVTSRSRASLLSGKLAVGNAALEARNFELNPALVAGCDRRYPPALFHKKDVTDGARGSLGEDLSRAVLSPNHRVVGVVINAIDDRLAGAEQIRDEWTIQRIGPLGSLLTLARDSGRVVVLASDHGHVWHRAEMRSVPLEVAARWRTLDGGEAAEDELLLTGGRVRDQAGDGTTVVVPWSEKVRYGRSQNGYHGGVTPQEMICPLVILTDRSSETSGLFASEYGRPAWWTPAPSRSPAPAEDRPAPAAVASRPSRWTLDLKADAPGPTPAASPSSAGWIDRLLASPIYKAQKDQVRRHPPADEVVRRALVALVEAGGLMTPDAFALAAGIPGVRLAGLVSQMQRILNVDGYEVLSFVRNENRIELNAAMLTRQFELD